MAVVKSWQTRFEDEKFVVRVRFSARSGRFAITLPEAIKRCMGEKEVGSDTLEGVEAEYQKTLKEYRASKTTERKVIVYKVEANAWVFRRRNGAPGHIHDDDAEVLFQAKDISFADGCGLTIYATVMMERTLTPTHGEPYISYADVEHNLPRSLEGGDGRVADEFGSIDGVQVIDWTPERETWFAHIGRQLEDMVVNVCKTLGDPNKAVELMDSGRMLMGPSDKEGE
jgi:hypothetical protein